MTEIKPPLNRWLTWERIGSEPVYMFRLTLLRLPGARRLYLHRFVGDDWCLDPHDHPKVFWSIGLRGSYVEEVYEVIPGGCVRGVRLKEQITFRAPWIRRFEPSHTHRIRASSTGGAWTLVFTGPETDEWGFWLEHKVWIPFADYLKRFAPGRELKRVEKSNARTD